mgnify:FL=1
MKTLKYAWRFLIRSKSYTIINLLGLAFSLACCIILLRYIHRELTVDTHCIDREQVYGVIRNMEGNRALATITNYKDSMYIDNRYIDKRTSIIPLDKDYISYNQKRYPARVLVTDSCFFQLFPYRALQGTLSLSAPESALLSESYARKLFGKENPVGKVLRYTNGKDVTIMGIVAAPDNKTSLQFDVVLSSSLTRYWERMPMEFIKFMPGTDIKLMDEIGNHPRWINPQYKEYDNRQYTFSFMPVADIYWDNAIIEATGCPNIFSFGNYSHILILSGLCLLLLLMGIMNFINIYLIFMLMRSREYGIKKVFGSNRTTLFLQIWIENFLLVSFALLMAWFIIEIMSTPIERLLSYPFSYTTFDILLSVAILVFLPLFTSLYPFMKYSYTPPMVSIRNISTGFQSVRIRMVFLAVQYVFTFLLITLSLYFNEQLSLLLHTNPGFRTENILIAKLAYESSDAESYRDPNARNAQKQRKQEMVNALSQCPFVEQWELSYETILSSTFDITYQNDKGEKVDLKHWYATPGFFKVYGLKILEGALPMLKDSERRESIIAVNRAALKALHYSSLEGAVVIEDSEQRGDANAQKTPIVAVIEDYYSGHLTAGQQPTIFRIGNSWGGDHFQIAYTPGRLNDLLEYLRKLELQLYGTESFEYSLLEDDVKAIYKEDRQVATVYSIFSGIAIVISCLGLFGISLFDIRQRYREIAIRKVNGAQLRNLYPLLFRKYMIVLSIAFLLAIPLACYIIYEYTKDFVVKAPISVGIFVSGLIVVILISIGTLLWQVYRAANINPAEIIKSE